MRHLYLHVVPPCERSTWPLQIDGVLTTFLDDVVAHAHALSRQQIVSAIVDVGCG